MGKRVSFFFCFKVFWAFCSLVNALRMALVFFILKSLLINLEPAEAFRIPSFCCWLCTVRTRAMDLRTCLILAILEAAPPVTLATWRSARVLRFSLRVLRSSSLGSPLSSYALTILNIYYYKTLQVWQFWRR